MRRNLRKAVLPAVAGASVGGAGDSCDPRRAAYQNLDIEASDRGVICLRTDQAMHSFFNLSPPLADRGGGSHKSIVTAHEKRVTGCAGEWHEHQWSAPDLRPASQELCVVFDDDDIDYERVLTCPCGASVWPRKRESMMRRVEWTEVRPTEIFRIIADETATGWAFFEKSVWEVRWYSIGCTKERLAKATRLAASALDRGSKHAKAA